MPALRFRRVAQLWNWLPSFRGVAEHESMQEAADWLGISPSALSRTVKLLEDAVGAELFVRHSGGLRLTPEGADLLEVTRDAMRAVDECLERVGADSARAAERVVGIGCASDAIAAVVARALPHEPSDLRVDLRLALRDEASWLESQLLVGAIDLAFGPAPAAASGLESSQVGTLTFGLYHPPPSAAADARRETTTEAHAVVPDGVAGDALAMTVASSLDAVRAIARASGRPAVLPDLGVDAGDGFVRIAGHGEPVPVHATWRRPVGPTRPPRIERLVEAVRSRLR
ncbi:MAG: LysR family transcriptional regulator [Deltaproteobacteria bacterium]|nr:LysR family transcriptional regulator [Deltaproteobacteria bacterium]